MRGESLVYAETKNKSKLQAGRKCVCGGEGGGDDVACTCTGLKAHYLDVHLVHLEATIVTTMRMLEYINCSIFPYKTTTNGDRAFSPKLATTCMPLHCFGPLYLTAN